MRHLVENIDRVTLELARAGTVLLLLDYDGTLTPIVSTPQDALLESGARDILERLSELPGVTVAIVSGRSLKQLDELVGIPGIVLAGNHGYEVRLPSGEEVRHYGDADIGTAREVREFLLAAARGIAGTLVEDKGPVVAFHWRNSAVSCAGEIERIIARAKEEFAGRVTFGTGKKVFETRPINRRSKGTAALEIADGFSAGADTCVFYFGDDVTDEDAFKALRGKAWTVFVGKKDATSSAEYYLESTSQVLEFLKHVLEVIGKRSTA
jgi:trehalose-phosphatase